MLYFIFHFFLAISVHVLLQNKYELTFSFHLTATKIHGSKESGKGQFLCVCVCVFLFLFLFLFFIFFFFNFYSLILRKWKDAAFMCISALFLHWENRQIMFYVYTCTLRTWKDAALMWYLFFYIENMGKMLLLWFISFFFSFLFFLFLFLFCFVVVVLFCFVLFLFIYFFFT